MPDRDGPTLLYIAMFQAVVVTAAFLALYVMILKSYLSDLKGMQKRIESDDDGLVG